MTSDDERPDGSLGPHDRFDERDEVVLGALALGWTHAEAAALVGLEAKWVQRRIRDDAFKLEVRRRRTVQLDAIAGQLGAIGPRAVTVILEAMSDRDPSIRLRAAVAALNTMTKLGRQADVEQRLADLEAKSLEAGQRRGDRRAS